MCANSWDNRDASVICREIGYSPFGELVSSLQSSQVSTQYTVVDVDTSSNEQSVYSFCTDYFGLQYITVCAKTKCVPYFLKGNKHSILQMSPN